MKKSQLVGYVRVSSEDQNPERQLEGLEVDKLYIDKVSGKDVNRPGLEDMLRYIREGDTLVVHSMDRLARNLDDLRALVQRLTNSGISIRFVKEGLTFTGDDTPMSKLLLSLMGAVAEFERAHIRERQLEGIKLAKQKGLYKGRQPKLKEDQLTALYERFRAGEKKTEIAKDLNICRETLYKHYRIYKGQQTEIPTIARLNISTSDTQDNISSSEESL